MKKTSSGSEPWELRPLYEDLVAQDLRPIPEERWREIVAELSALKTDPYAGKPLVHQPLMGGDLSDCRSLPVTDLRIVYRLDEDSRAVDIIAIGVRQGSAVYKTALDRLGRRKRVVRRRSPFWGS